MQIKVKYTESSYEYEIRRIYTGALMNVGGRNLPF